MRHGGCFGVPGGLPYHGGPGSNYVAHSIAAVVEEIRSRAESSPSPVKGMVCANGGFLTKHAVGIYSSHPLESRTFERREPEDYVDRSGDLGVDAYTFEPCGTGRIIGWTVEYAARPNTPLRGLIVGEIVECGEGEDGESCEVGQRFIATTAENDTATMEWLLEEVSFILPSRILRVLGEACCLHGGPSKPVPNCVGDFCVALLSL